MGRKIARTPPGSDDAAIRDERENAPGQNALDIPSAIPQRSRPRTRRELAAAVFAECDPVQIGIELLRSGNERSSAVKARVWETLIEYQFGKPVPMAERADEDSVPTKIIFRY